VPTTPPSPLPSPIPTAVPTPVPTALPTPLPTPLPTVANLYAETTISGTYSLKFYDVFGEDYTTPPIIYEDYTYDHTNNVVKSEVDSCSWVTSALESLPDSVVPKGSVACSETNYGKGYAAECGNIYSLTFTGNPGILKELEVDYYDGGRPTLFNQWGYAGLNISSMVYTKGVPGADVDYFATKCEGVKVKTKFAGDMQVPYKPSVNIWGAIRDIDSDDEYSQLARCLGDSDGSAANNVDTTDWDYGSYVPTDKTYEKMGGNPHIVKMVPTTKSDNFAPAYYHLVWGSQLYTYSNWTSYASTEYGKVFWLASPPVSETEEYNVYATDGVAEIVFYDTDEDHDLDVVGEPRVTATFSQGSKVIYTSYDTACESASSFIHPCLDKGDMIFLFDSNWGRISSSEANNDTIFGSGGYHTVLTDVNKANNAWKYNNYETFTNTYYTITKIYKEDPTANTFSVGEDRFRIVVDKGINWGATNYTDPDGDGLSNTGYVQIIKFSPATTGNYQFVSECSNRGVCDSDSGMCDCNAGWEGGACTVQNALAM